MLRVLAVSAAGVALLALGVVFAVGWLAVWSVLFPPAPSGVCYCPDTITRLVLPPSPGPILIGYAIAGPALSAIGGKLLANRIVPISRTSRIAGVLLLGSTVGTGAILLALFTNLLSTGSTGVLVALAAFLAAPVVVLTAAVLLLYEELRGRLARTPSAPAE